MPRRTKSLLTCLDCGRFMSGKNAGPCSNCGGTTRSLVLNDNVVLSEGSLEFRSTRISWEKNLFLIMIVILLTIAGSSTGFFLANWTGFAIGLFLSLATNVIGLYMFTRVREVKVWKDG